MTDPTGSDQPGQWAQESPLSSTAASDPAAVGQSGGLRLARLSGVHALVLLLALGLFAAADSWRLLTGLGIAGLLCIVSGALAGLTATTLVHEWFHLLGARLSGGRYGIPEKVGLFVYEWDFAASDRRQFFIMSVAGSVGGALSLLLLWLSVPADTAGRAALHGGALAGFVFGSCIEWPVLKRTRDGGDPLEELSRIDGGVLSRSFGLALVAGIALTLFVAP